MNSLYLLFGGAIMIFFGFMHEEAASKAVGVGLIWVWLATEKEKE